MDTLTAMKHAESSSSILPSPSGSMSMPVPMSSMASTFSVNTHVTLWFTDWTTTTPGAYFLTVVFLFSLGLFNRFLGALKTQLERKWNNTTTIAYDNAVHKESSSPSDRTTRGHLRNWSQILRPHTSRTVSRVEHEIEPLSPGVAGIEAIDPAESPRSQPRTFWVARGRWSLKRDGISAFLEFIRALVGYVLMLAVMTYNVGFLFAVTGSVLMGELLFGRYTQGPKGWQEGGCHE
ncbi:hypothetical protein BU24DRAFT_428252 [Aaosphaeria arxii CBS 175.79]|uniref:Copper transport protein n=1 Tax=Aaosphaeria arxii CBS 175.79 TaxID=1450172 RepID=A0A6A5XB92_9PLEO|nr:uncharacterized protein BU24DRAFT_428252 [Aaosphaeria arxii CBS 175.79]KAF2010248.1 hypothetical protein BU24DRAFT_428252 [Aaosphaeria arxii CBS 175.79]